MLPKRETFEPQVIEAPWRPMRYHTDTTTGQAYLNKFIQGQLTRVATATHSALGHNFWFTAEVVRRGPNATVKVNNQIVFAFDCGQAMCEPVGGLPRIDRAVTAALTASYVALKGGDRVALFGFAQRPELSTPFVGDSRN